jgi:hypothetical protein
MKNLHVRLHMLRVHKVVSRKTDMSFRLRKNKIDAKSKTFYGIYFVFFTPINVFFVKLYEHT